jgi:hypothetical protein
VVNYEKQNVNFKNKKTGDCVTRALVTATGLSYREVAKIQFDLWMKTGFETCDKKTYSKILEDLGFIKHKMPKRYLPSGNKRYTVGEINELVLATEVALIDLAHHCTAYLGDTETIIDIWDCRSKSIGNYWTRDIQR